MRLSHIEGVYCVVECECCFMLLNVDELISEACGERVIQSEVCFLQSCWSLSSLLFNLSYCKPCYSY